MKYFGKDGIVIKLYEEIDKISDMYVEALMPQGDASCNILELRYANEDEMASVWVRFDACGCDTDGFEITEAMFQNPKREIKKILEAVNKEKQRKKWREAKERQREKTKEFHLYERLKKKYENK